MKRVLIGLLTAVSLGGCIRDDIETCPPLGVTLEVADKNYFNASRNEIMRPVDENLPFCSYVPSLRYILRDAATGRVVADRPLYAVTGDEREHRIESCPRLPHGRYVLTVWGGLEELHPLDGQALSIDLHPDVCPVGNLCVAHDTLLYDAWHSEYRMALERTHGRLVVEVVGLPESSVRAMLRVADLHARVDYALGYTGRRSVTHEALREGAEPWIIHCPMAPSVDAEGARLEMDFYESPAAAESSISPAAAEPSISARPVAVTLRRNELTLVRYVWEEERGEFRVYMMVDGAWREIVDLDIEEEL